MVTAASGPDAAAALIGEVETLARAITAQHLARHPGMRERLPQAQRRWEEDSALHLRHLAAGLATGRPALVDGYLAWYGRLLRSHGIGAPALVEHLLTLVEVTASRLGPAVGGPLEDLVDGALRRLEPSPHEPASYLRIDDPHGRLAQDFLAALLEGERRDAVGLMLDAVDGGLELEDLYLEVLQPALREVGRLWQLGRIGVAEEHLVTAASQLVMALLYPRVVRTPKGAYRVLVASIGGELHELGGRMLADVFELRGWTAYFVGANTPTPALVELARSREVHVVALSATLSAHVPAVTEVVRATRQATDAAILVGGRAFLEVPDLWPVTRADGSADDAVGAVVRAAELVAAT